jgi:small-conductance mechanosensitive channel
VQQVLLVAVVLAATLALARFAERYLQLHMERHRGALPVTSIFTNVTRMVVYLIGTLIILQALGIAITPILTALGVGGLAVALALQDTMANLFSGLHIIASRQVRPGDYIKLDSGEEGYISDITWRSTTIRERPDNMIIVPNAKLASATITNYDRPEAEISVPIQVGVSYDSDLAAVERITLSVAQEVMRAAPEGVPDFQPAVRYSGFGDSSVNLTVLLRAREFDAQYGLRHVFIKRLHERFRRDGVEIPFPSRTVYVKGQPQRKEALT